MNKCGAVAHGRAGQVHLTGIGYIGIDGGDRIGAIQLGGIDGEVLCIRVHLDLVAHRCRCDADTAGDIGQIDVDCSRGIFRAASLLALYCGDVRIGGNHRAVTKSGGANSDIAPNIGGFQIYLCPNIAPLILTIVNPGIRHGEDIHGVADGLGEGVEVSFGAADRSVDRGPDVTEIDLPGYDFGVAVLNVLLRGDL